MLGRLSLRARLAARRDRARGGRARRRRRRDLHVAALVPVRPHRQHARRPLAAERVRRRAPVAGAGPGGPAARTSWLLAGRTASSCGRSTGRSLAADAACRSSPGGDAGRRRSCPATITLPGAATRARAGPRPLLHRAGRAGGGRYRVRASIEPGEPNRVLVDRRPARRVDSTLHRLLLIELLVTLAVLAGARPRSGSGSCASACGRSRDRADGRGDRRRRPLAAASSAPTSAPRSAGSGSRSTRCSPRSSRRSARARPPSSKLRRFVADASHELRTPLAAVRAYAELFERGADDAARRPRARR